jgi:hypothetical protein
LKRRRKTRVGRLEVTQADVNNTMRMAVVRKSRIENKDGKGWPKILEAAKT